MNGTPIVWTIGGSDSGGGAGIQADLATFNDFGVHGCSVVTTVTAQNTCTFVDGFAVPAESVRAQLQALAADLPPVAIKIGALGSRENVAAVLAFLDDVDAFVVWDPVEQASVGGALGPALTEEYRFALLGRADVVTPNADELAAWGLDPSDPATAAEALARRVATTLLLKGGHTADRALDYWQLPDDAFWLEGPCFDGNIGHGGGCTLAAAIAAARARGFDRYEWPVVAKAYLTQGLRHPVPVGAGRSPVGHQGMTFTLADLPKVHDTRPWPVLQFPPLDTPHDLYVIADSAAWVRRLAELNVPLIQLRIKDRDPAEIAAEIRASVAAVDGTRSRLFVNDYWAAAIAAGAYGVHLGQEDLTDADVPAIAAAGTRLGISCHSDYEIARAHAFAPSYIALGPIYATTVKPMAFKPQGLERLARWVDLLGQRYPVIAIGGIDADRVDGVMRTGVHGICVIRAVRDAPDPAGAVAALRRALDRHSAVAEPDSRGTPP